jgi:hypothetical protein
MDVNFHIPIAVFWILFPAFVAITSYVIVFLLWALATSKAPEISPRKLEIMSSVLHFIMLASPIIPFLVAMLYLLAYKYFGFF